VSLVLLARTPAFQSFFFGKRIFSWDNTESTMTIQDLFTDSGPLKGFKKRNKKCLIDKPDELKRAGVDISILLHRFSSDTPTAMANTAMPRYESQHLNRRIDQVQHVLAHVFEQIVYVFEGVDLKLKNETKEERKSKAASHCTKLKELVKKAERGESISDSDVGEAQKCRKSMSLPNEDIYGQVIKYMKEKGMVVFGAYGEAEAQLVEFQNAGLIDTIITTDADLIALGSKHVMFDFNLWDTAKESSFLQYSREDVMSLCNGRYPLMVTYQDRLHGVTTFLGTDYQKRILNHSLTPRRVGVSICF